MTVRHPARTPTIRFDDGAAYESFMGVWSRLAGERFLDWLSPAPGGRWADIGCGNGAFTELLLERAAPTDVQGIDPSEGQIAYARERLETRPVRFEVGTATALPYPDDAFDAAVMALVIFFVPDPTGGVAEMARVVRPGGSVSAYAWDLLGGGFPYAAVQEEMAALGVQPLGPPSAEASRTEAMRALWADAGLVGIETHTIAVQRSFDDFDAFWRIARSGPGIAPQVAAMAEHDGEQLKDRLRARLRPDADGRITCGASANAIQGRVPA